MHLSRKGAVWMAKKKDTAPKVDTKGKKKKNEDEDEEEGSYTGSMRGQRGPGGAKDFRKPKDTKGTLLRLLNYVVANKALLIAVLVMMLISTLANLGAGYFLKPLIDGESWNSHCWMALAGELMKLLGIYILGAAASYGQGLLMSFLSQRAINKLRKDLFDKLQEMPISYYDAHGNGEIMSRFTNDADNVQMAMEQTVTMLISSVLTFVGTVAMMIYLNYILFIITVAVLVVDYIIVQKISKKSKKLYRKQQKNLGQVNAYVEEMVEGIKVVKAFNYEEEIKEEFTEKNIAYRDAAMDATYVGMIIMPVLNQVMGICYGGRSVRHQRNGIWRRGLYHRLSGRVPELHQAGGNAHQPGVPADCYAAECRGRCRADLRRDGRRARGGRRHHHHGARGRKGQRGLRLAHLLRRGMEDRKWPGSPEGSCAGAGYFLPLCGG